MRLFLTFLLINIQLYAFAANDVQQRIYDIENRISEIKQASPQGIDIREKISNLESRIEKLKSQNQASPSADNGLLQEISFPGIGQGQLLSPKGIDADNKGVYIADYDNKRIQLFDKKGAYINSFNTIGGGLDSQLQGPVDVAIGFGGSVYVADSDLNKIVKYDENGNYLLSFGGLGNKNGQFNDIRGIRVDNKGYIYAADSGNDRIQKFSPQGDFVATFGSFGRGDSNFDSPVDIDIDGIGNIYVLDGNSRTVKVYNEYFQPLRQFSCDIRNKKASLTSLKIEKEIIYVVDNRGEALYVFSTKGEYIKSISGGMKEPYDVSIFKNLYISDNGRHKILVYKKE